VSEERQRVLRMLKDGRVTIEEAEALLEALGEVEDAEPARPAAVPGTPSTSESAPASADAPDTGASGDRSGAQQQAGDRRTEFHRMLDDLMRAVDVDGIMESVRESLKRSKVDMDRVKEEVLRATDRVREETRRAAREYRRHGWGRISRTIEGLWGLTPAAGVWSHESDLAAGRRLIVHNLWGDVKVKPSPDGRLRATAVTRAWGRDQAEATVVLDAIRIAVEDAGGLFTIRVEPPAEEYPHRFRVDIDLQVPAQIAVEISQAKGDVAASGLSGRFEAVVVSGDVSVRDQDGPVRVEVAKGDVTVARAGGDVHVKTKHGNVTLSAVGGGASAQVMHGDVVVSGARGGVEAHTMHGDIRLAGVAGRLAAGSKHGDVILEAPAGAVFFDFETTRGGVQAHVEQFVSGTTSRMSTMSGDLTVRLGPEARCRLSARVTAGEIEIRAALTERQESRRSLQGVYGSADAVLELATVTGSVTVDAAAADVTTETVAGV
jgi:hypothetical protein